MHRRKSLCLLSILLSPLILGSIQWLPTASAGYSNNLFLASEKGLDPIRSPPIPGAYSIFDGGPFDHNGVSNAPIDNMRDTTTGTTYGNRQGPPLGATGCGGSQNGVMLLKFTGGASATVARLRLAYYTASPFDQNQDVLCLNVYLLNSDNTKGTRILQKSVQHTVSYAPICTNCKRTPLQDETVTFSAQQTYGLYLEVLRVTGSGNQHYDLHVAEAELNSIVQSRPDGRTYAHGRATMGGSELWWSPHDGVESVDGYSIFYSSISRPNLGETMNASGYTYAGTYPCCAATIHGLVDRQPYYWRVLPVNPAGEGHRASEEFITIPGTGGLGSLEGRDVSLDLLREVWETYGDGPRDARRNPATVRHVGWTLSGTGWLGNIPPAQTMRAVGDQNVNSYIEYGLAGQAGGSTSCQSSTQFTEIKFQRPITFNRMRVAFSGSGSTAASYCFQLSRVDPDGLEFYISATMKQQAASSTGTGGILQSSVQLADFPPVTTDTIRYHILPQNGNGAGSLNDLALFNTNDTYYPYPHALADAFLWNSERLITVAAGPSNFGSAFFPLTADYDYYVLAATPINGGLAANGQYLAQPIFVAGVGVTTQLLGYTPVVDPDGSGRCAVALLKIHAAANVNDAFLRYNGTGAADWKMCRLQASHTYALPTPGAGGRYIRADLSPWGGTTNDIWGILYATNDYPIVPSTDADLSLSSHNDLDGFQPASAPWANADYMVEVGLSVQTGKLAGSSRIVVLGQQDLTLDSTKWKLKVNGFQATRLYGGTCNAGSYKCAVFLLDDAARRNRETQPDNITLGHGSMALNPETYALQLSGTGYNTARAVSLMVPTPTGEHFSFACQPNGMCASNSRLITTMIPVENVPPPVPTASCSDGNSQVAVSWNSVPGALNYKVWYDISPHPEADQYVFWTTTSATTSTITGLTNGNRYYVRVVAVGPGGESAGSPDATCRAVAPPAGAPIVTATRGDSEVRLIWASPSSADEIKPDFAGATTSCTNTGTVTHVNVVAGGSYIVVGGKNSATAPTTDRWSLAPPGRAGDVLVVNKDGTLGGPAAATAKLLNHTNASATQWYAQVAFTWPADRGTQANFYCDGGNAVRGWILPPGVGSDFGMPGYVGDWFMNNVGDVGYLFSSASSGPVTDYEIWYDTASHPSPPAGYTFLRSVTGTTTVHTGLTNGQTYHYVVRAKNGGGLGPFSTDVSATPQPGAPSSPPTLSGDRRGINLLRTATLTTFACSACPTVKGASADYDESSVQFWTTPTARSTASCTTEAHSIITYTFPEPVQVASLRIKAQNTHFGGGVNHCVRAEGTLTDGTNHVFGTLGIWGAGNPPSIHEGNLNFPPLTVTKISFIMVCSTCSPATTVSLAIFELQAWDSPQTSRAGLWWTTTGGATAYSLFQSAQSAAPAAPMNASGDYQYVRTLPPPQSGTLVETLVTGLNADSANFFRVVAANGGGEGPASNEVQIVTVPSPPSGMSILTLNPGDGGIGITWTAVSRTDVYSLFFSTTARALQGNLNQSGYTYLGSFPGTTFTHTGLVNGQFYYYRVVAANAGGEGPASAEAAAAPAIGAPPSILLRALDPTGNPPGRGVSIQWTNPTSSGFAGVEIRRNLSGFLPAILVLLPAANQSFVDTTAPEGVNVTYWVHSRTAVNTGGGRNATVLTAPGTPKGFSVQGASGNLNASWIASPGALSYTVLRSDGRSSIVQAPQRWFLDPGLPIGATYTYNVSATNSAGTSLPTDNETGIVGYDVRRIAPGLRAIGNFSRLIPDQVMIILERTDTQADYYVSIAKFDPLDGTRLVTTPYAWDDGTPTLIFNYTAQPSRTRDAGAYWCFVSLPTGENLGGFAFQILPDWESRLLPAFIFPSDTLTQLDDEESEELGRQVHDAINEQLNAPPDIFKSRGLEVGAEGVPLVFAFAMICVIAAVALSLVSRR